jgi:hypothetical protein
MPRLEVGRCPSPYGLRGSCRDKYWERSRSGGRGSSWEKGKKMFQNDQECIGFMTETVVQIEELMTILGETPERLPQSRVGQSREMLGSIKNSLHDYYYQNRSFTVRSEMLPIEQSRCFPAIQRAYYAINVRSNSRPNIKWISELYDARFEIQYHLDQLVRDS